MQEVGGSIPPGSTKFNNAAPVGRLFVARLMTVAAA